jgi:hypothetical protein
VKFLCSALLSFGVHGAFFALNPEAAAGDSDNIARIVSSLCIGFGLVYGIHFATRKD